MINAKALLSDLQKLLVTLETDLRQRCTNHADVDQPLRAQYAAAKAANRTAQAYEVWRDEQITQAAVAWILGCVFVRFCEDNHLIDPPRLSGPGERRQRAEDEHTLYFQKHPTHTDREYLQWVFEQVAQLPAMKELFDKRHNPLWSLGVSGDGAMALRNFFLRRDAGTGLLMHDFSDPAFSSDGPALSERSELKGDPTRFLGDLYQDLSESARKKFALLQTPVFVEEFILDRTLTPAIREFGFRQVRMIDPTCGSGHFLLGGFQHLFDLWVNHDPAANVRALAQRALDGVYGVDLNPYAVAIARFRLLVATLRACGIPRLADAPGFAFHLAVGDSLLHGPRPDVTGGRQHHLLGEDPLSHFYDTEDAALLNQFLGRQYHAVVGNPPYIVVRDKALNDAYRDRYPVCHMKYSLAVPFFQRFFDLALSGNKAGFVGMITANSFMKREFGKKLIEHYMPRWDLTHIIDTSGAYIPGHGTPTVIFFARNRRPSETTIRTMMGIAGEPATPAVPAQGLVWSAIINQIDRVGSQSNFISVVDAERSTFHHHPWSMGGGGVAELRELVEDRAAMKVKDFVESTGFMAIVAEEDAFVVSSGSDKRHGVPTRRLIAGESVRDWNTGEYESIIFPYDNTSAARPLEAEHHQNLIRFLWPCRTTLRSRQMFGKTVEQHGFKWYEYLQFIRERVNSLFLLAFGEVATHNHFVLNRGGTLFNQTAPVSKLAAIMSEEEHLGLLGVLNSSVSCFWLKQVCFPKGGDHVGQEGARVRRSHWDERYAFNGSKIEEFPLPASKPLELARHLDLHARAYAAKLPTELVRIAVPNANTLEEARRQADDSLRVMVALQEELDWECYRIYGLIDADLAHGVLSYALAAVGSTILFPPPPDHVPKITFGQRAFEIALARKMAAGEVETTWFERHHLTPTTEIPDHWPEDYKDVVRRRIEIIENDRNIALIERPEYKRRWNTEPWIEMQERALRSWLLDRLEGWPLVLSNQVDVVAKNPGAVSRRSLLWSEKEPRLMSVALLADRVRQDKDFMQVAGLYRDRDDFDLTKLVAELVEDEAVPALSALRYKESGLRNRRVWERVWDLQRLEDIIDARTKLPPTDPQYLTELQANAEKKAKVGDIPVPPKYKSADMLPGPIWRLRGKLDVPKERFVSFPHCQRDADQTLVITWAGFDHLQQLQAVAAYYMEMKEREGWPPERRVPLLAAMLALLPWVLQWHNAVHPDFGVGLGDYYRDFVNEEAKEMGKTVDEVRAWVPATKAAGRGRKVKA